MLADAPRQRRAPVRARVLDPAPPPEGDRGEPVARRSPPSCASAWASLALALVKRAGYVNAGTLEFLVDAGPQPLLPGDEHAPAGRAPGHRDGDRRRPGEAADPRRPGRARCPSRRSDLAPARPRHRVPRLRRGPGQRLPAQPRDASTPCACPAAPASATTPASTRAATVSDPLRPADLEAGGARRRPRRGHRAACGARSPSTPCSGIKTTLPFFDRVLRHPAFVSGDYDTSFIETALPRTRRTPPSAPGTSPWPPPPSHAHRERQQAAPRRRRRGRARGSAWRGARRGATRGSAGRDLRRHRRRPHGARRGARRGRRLHRARGRPRPERRARFPPRAISRPCIIDGRSHDAGVLRQGDGTRSRCADGAFEVDAGGRRPRRRRRRTARPPPARRR